MSAVKKAEIYRQLKDAGVAFAKVYRDYTTDDLVALAAAHNVALGTAKAPTPAPAAPTPVPDLQSFIPQQTPPPAAPPATELAQVVAPARIPDPHAAAPARDEMAGLRQNTKNWDEPIRTDSDGTIWFQDEVRKPAYPKPRGRRVLQYTDPGVQRTQIKVGDYIETFEVAGQTPTAAEVRITLPSFQVGIYKDPRYPFRIHVYNDTRGFNLDDVRMFYGGAEMVPPECKLIYIENVLCYDMRSVIRAVMAEARQLNLR